MGDDSTTRRWHLEWRQRQEEVEDAEAALAGSTRTLRDLFVDEARRGRSMSVHLPGRVVAGRIVHVGVDVVGVDDGRLGRLVAPVSAIEVVHVGEPSTPGVVTTGHPGTLVAAARSAVQGRSVVEIATGTAGTTTGRLRTVSADHLVLDTAPASNQQPIRRSGRRTDRTVDAEIVVPLRSIVWLREIAR